jgi:glucosamine-6-phosphate deaminase
MKVIIRKDAREMGRAAAATGSELVRQAIEARDAANIIVATGASQFEMLEALVRTDMIDWAKVTGFHLDEYIGLPFDHPASFRGYLKQRLVDRVPLREFHYVNGESDPEDECRRLGVCIAKHPIDVAFVGIGENGHLAFNDPPADFDVEDPYIVVELDEACRRQQLGEGWFPTLEDVPRKAISMSIKHILRSAAIVCTVPDARKARAVKAAVEGKITPEVPASALQRHPNVQLFLDEAAATFLSTSGDTKV